MTGPITIVRMTASNADRAPPRQEPRVVQKGGNDRKNGGRHCHRGPNAGEVVTPPRGERDYYPNCAAARGAGVTPIYRGQSGYGVHLDRDGDGKACE